MKVRTKKAKKLAKRRANPMRLDPTRTATLRRVFSSEVAKRFNALRLEVEKLIVDEDALGLLPTAHAPFELHPTLANSEWVSILNAFCPTGVGGGIDASCSPNGSALRPSISSRLKHKIGLKFKKFEERYGRKAAIAVIAASVAMTFVPLPGTSLIPVAVAEAVRVFGKLMTSKTIHNRELDDDWVKEQARKLLEELVVEYDKDNTENAGQWRFQSDPAKVKAFQAWLKAQIVGKITSDNERKLWEKYAQAGFQKGAGRAFDDTNKARKAKAGQNQSKLDFYRGNREQFLRSAFAQPVAVEKVQLLAGRSFDDLSGITSDMSTRMSRTLTDGLVEGKGPRDIARDLEDEVDIGRDRALVIARTEIVRAHAEGQLEALDQMGVEEVGVAVEWTVTPDDRVCPKCAAMEGVVLKLDEARGLIPRHPSCRCAWVPANVGEDDEDQKDTKGEIAGAIKESARKGPEDSDLSWPGTEKVIDKKRPESLFNVEHNGELQAWSTFRINSFCPTGEGGGVDPSCSTSVGSAVASRKEKGESLRLAQAKKEYLKARRDLLKHWEDRPSVVAALDDPTPHVERVFAPDPDQSFSDRHKDALDLAAKLEEHAKELGSYGVAQMTAKMGRLPDSREMRDFKRGSEHVRATAKKSRAVAAVIQKGLR